MTRNILFAALFTVPLCLHADELRTVTVVGVSDGATIVVQDGKRKYRVRLAAIDAPEYGQPFAKSSGRHLADLTLKKQALVDCYKTDAYRRKVCRVSVVGKDVALAQLQAGLAWYFKQAESEQTASERKAYAQAEEDARSSRRGLWKLDNQVPPWEFRRKGNR